MTGVQTCALPISYIIAGTDALEYETALKKLKKLFGIKNLMLGGGGVLNWSFIQAGMCDEVSIVIAAAADGSQNTPALFSAREGLSSEQAVRFSLQSVEAKNGGCVWLRYNVCTGKEVQSNEK